MQRHGQLSTGKALPVGQWVHVGFRIANADVVDHSGDKIVSLFVDGYEVASRKGDRRPGSREEFTVSLRSFEVELGMENRNRKSAVRLRR